MLKFLRICFLVVPYVVFNYPRVLYYSLRKEHISRIKIYNYANRFIKRLLRLLGMRLEVLGKENLPVTDSFLLVGNHQSIMDPLIVVNAVENGPLAFVAKKELKKVIGVNSFLNMLNGLFMDRSSLRKEMEVMKKVRSSLKENNIAWCIFPEGTRTKNEDYSPNEFLPGALKMAIIEKKTIVPFVLDGGYEVLKLKGKWLSKTTIKFFPSLTYQDYKDLTTIEIAQKIELEVKNEQKLLFSKHQS